ncbi:MAG: SpoIIE family protein phosphatase [bacterium]
MHQNFKIWKISLLLLLGLFVFLYIVAATGADLYLLMTEPVAGISYEFREDLGKVAISHVMPKGPAKQSGVEEGDVVLAFNNTPIKSEDDLLEAYKKVEIGQPVEITILRNYEKHTFTFVAERRSKVYTQAIFFGLLPGVVFCYALCLIGMFVLLKKVQDRTAHIFYLMVLFWALAMQDAFPFEFYALQKILPVSDILGWVLLPVWPLAVGLLLHFFLIFPTEKEIIRQHPKLTLTVIYSPLVLIIPYVFAVVNHLSWSDRILRIGWGIWLTFNFCAAMNVLAHSVRRAPNPKIKTQAQIMFYGTTFSLGLPLLLYFLPNLLFNQTPPFAEFIVLMVILWPMILAYVIVKHRFMDIDVIVKRSVAYALMSGFVIGAYFLLVVGVGHLVLLITGSSGQIVTIIATLLIAALFNPVKNRIRNFVDRRFYPSRFIYHEVVQSFRHHLVKVVDLEKLSALLLSFIHDTMRIRPVVLLWQRPEGDKLAVHSARGELSDPAVLFRFDDQVLKKLQKTDKLVDLSPLKENPELISEDELRRWRTLKAEIVLPLLFKSKLIGVLSLGEKEKDETYYKEDLDLLESLGDQINISLENALLTEELREQDRLKHELEVAQRIQLSSLPQADPQIPGLEISGISIPALEVGGDYYDYLDLSDGRFGVVVGDVSGKGTSAALYMSQLKGILKTAAKYHRSLKELVSEVNAITFDSMELQSYITLTVGAFDLDQGKLKLVRAGHLPLVYYCAKDKFCKELVPRGLGVGLEKGKLFDKEIEELEIAFKPGDIFLFYTDGIVEARDSQGREFETKLLADLIQENGWNSAASLREKIITRVQQFSADGDPNDDMTVVVVKVL